MISDSDVRNCCRLLRYDPYGAFTAFKDQITVGSTLNGVSWDADLVSLIENAQAQWDDFLAVQAKSTATVQVVGQFSVTPDKYYDAQVSFGRYRDLIGQISGMIGIRENAIAYATPRIT